MVEDFSKNEYYKEYYPPIGTFGIVHRDDATVSGTRYAGAVV